LGDSATRLLFLLVYLKTYPLQVVLAELFGLSTPPKPIGGCNACCRCCNGLWTNSVFSRNETAANSLPTPRQQLSRKSSSSMAPSAAANGQKSRKSSNCTAAVKKKTHSAKNVLVVNVQSERVVYRSQTYAGKAHEKKITDQETLAFPEDALLDKDLGFQGYELPVVRTCQVKKKRNRSTGSWHKSASGSSMPWRA
jgi:hypothetical protein